MTPDLFSHSGTVFSMRPYQQAAVDAAIAYLKQNPGKNPIISAATGTGKSVIIAEICRRILKANKIKIVVATHVQELVEQNSKKLQASSNEFSIGIYSAGLGAKEFGDVTFAGIQSVYRARNLPTIGLLIVDECHTISKKDESMWATLVGNLKILNPNMRIVGLSATPFRLDSGSMTTGDGAIFHDVVFDYDLKRGVDDGFLCTLKTKATETKYDISGVGKIGGEYNLKQLEEKTNTDDMNERAVLEMIKRAQDKKTWLIFCNGVDHSFSVRDVLRKYGISAETVTGETPDDERNKILDKFKSGKIRSVTNNAVWTTGLDVPNIDMIGMLRHTMSGGLLLQMAGRGTRATIDLSPYKNANERKKAIAESDKPYCLFLDFAGNIERHGFLDQIKAKDKKEKGDGVAPMKVCPDCFTICHAAAKHCPDCGSVFPVSEETKISEAYNGSVFSEPEWFNVLDVQYFLHNQNKDGKKPCIRVKYILSDAKPISEFINLENENEWARNKSFEWWRTREGPTIHSMNGLCQFIIENKMYEPLLVPRSIKVGPQLKNPKYDQVYDAKDFYKKDWTPAPERKAEDSFEIPW